MLTFPDFDDPERKLGLDHTLTERVTQILPEYLLFGKGIHPVRNIPDSAVIPGGTFNSTSH